ncbi:MAG: Calx-beta domain-containing protein [Verrucomicrobiota bacterium]
MHISLMKRAAVLCASAIAFASTAAFAQEWTSLKVGELANFSFSHAHLPDGRFLFGTEGKAFVQDTFGAAAATQVANPTSILLDPAFVISRSGTQALVGGGGFSGPSGVYLFDPSSPATPLVTPALATLQNYNAVFWKHPTSGREGWIIGGANAGFSSNLTFVSTDGQFTGAVTGALSAFSGGLTSDPEGNVFVSLADFDESVNNKVIKFTAAQVDAAVAAVLADNPVPLTAAASTPVFSADASSSLAADSAGRLWITGYQINHIQAYDPATGATRRFTPDHPALANAGGPAAYSVKVFSKDASEYVSFLANDSFYTTTSDLVLGYRPASEMTVRAAQITTASLSVSEGDASTTTVTVTLTPAASAEVTVPVTVAGTATVTSDYTTTAPASLVFAAGETSKTFDITVVNDSLKGEGNQTVAVTLGEPTPTALAGLGALNSEKFTLTIQDNDPLPIIGFASASRTVNEADGTVNVTVNVSPTVTQTVTVPLVITGTATSGADFTTVSELVIEPGDLTKTLAIQVLNDTTALEADETVIVNFGALTANEIGLGLPATRQFTLTIQDDENKARIAANQEFGTLRVGAALNVPVLTFGGTAVKWSAKGLPPGLKINANGTITGMPTASGEYDQVILTATNAYGVSTSVVLLMNVEAFPAGAVGTFSGLVDRAGSVTGGLGASVTVTTTAKATYTGKVVIGKKTYAIKGNLDAATANPSGFSDLKVGSTTQRLNFVLNATTGAFTGTLPEGAALAGWRAQPATTRTGIYNFRAAQSGSPAATVPQGASYGSLKLSPKAVATVTGVLADGSKFTCSSPLSIQGDVVLYQALYTTVGSLTGRVNLADDLAHSITGTLTWSKPEQAKGPVYQDGWESHITLVALGGKYRPAGGATLPLDAQESASDNAELVLQDGGIEAVGGNANPKTFGVRIVSIASATMVAPQKLKIVNATGAFSGSITLGEGASRKVIPVQGLLVPDAGTANAFDSEGFGYFLLPSAAPGVTRSGAVILSAVTDS